MRVFLGGDRAICARSPRVRSDALALALGTLLALGSGTSGGLASAQAADAQRGTPRPIAVAEKSDADNVVLLIHHAAERAQDVLEFRIPRSYVNGPAVAPINGFGLYFQVTYPDLRGQNYPRTIDLWNCRGNCNNRLNIEISNRVGDDWTEAKWATSAKRFNGIASLKRIHRVGFEEVYVRLDRRFNPPVTEEYYFSSQRNTYINCIISVPVPMCKESSPIPHTNAVVTYTFPYQLISSADDVRAAVSHLVSNFYVREIPAS
jgi:hypothetical protein